MDRARSALSIFLFPIDENAQVWYNIYRNWKKGILFMACGTNIAPAAASLKRDTYRRRANAMARQLNREIATNPRYKGRWYVTQKWSVFIRLSDHSGCMYVLMMELRDRATGQRTNFFWNGTYWMESAATRLRERTYEQIAEWEAECPDGRDFREETVRGKRYNSPHAPHPGDAPLVGPSAMRVFCSTHGLQG